MQYLVVLALLDTGRSTQRRQSCSPCHARSRGEDPSGTVQQLNSLRGAALVQGLVAAMLLSQRVHGLPITETHPKAVLWLLRIASLARGHADVPIATLGIPGRFKRA